MGTENNRKYIQNVARDFMGNLNIRTVDYKGYTDATTLARILFNTYLVDIIRLFREKKMEGEALGRIAWYGAGQAPLGDFQSWHIGSDVRPAGMHTTLDQVLDHKILHFHNGAYQLMQLAAATIVAEMVTLMHTKIMLGSVFGKDPEEVVSDIT